MPTPSAVRCRAREGTTDRPGLIAAERDSVRRMAGADRDKTERQRFTRWDLRAHWRTDVLCVLVAIAAAYCLLIRDSLEAAIGFAVLAAFLGALPRSEMWASLPFGSGIGAKRRGSKLPASEIATPQISSPLPPRDDPTEQKPDEQSH